MRKIKFRLWDTEEKCFMNHSRVIESRVLDLENNGEGRFIFQQWTGLLDRHGREIYEGDIVKYSFKDGEDINTRVLEIFNDGVNFKMKELHRDYWLEKIDGVLKIKHGHLTKYRGETNLLCDVSGLVIYWYEVIGNIYKHPHLLEGDSIENQ
ncbi:hypothetical protein MTP04_22610 [Lysinibacillus sp. PLM2]|nr:hypothetical protein MTP04_22610 [Lysinibacillus sp. PLM2]